MTEMIRCCRRTTSRLELCPLQFRRSLESKLCCTYAIKYTARRLRDPLRPERLSKQEFGETKPELGRWTRDGECLNAAANDLGVL